MLTKKSLIGLTALGALALNAVPAMAQVTAGSQEVHAYVGETFGDDLTDRRISGRTPELDDDVTYGLRYGYNFTDAWGLELSLGQTNSAVTGLPGRDIDLDLTTFDVDAVYHFNPSGRFVPYVVAGLGYASADLDRPIIGAVNGGSVRIGDDNGFTANAGVGAKYFVTDKVSLRLDARYRYLDKVVDRFDDSLNTFETTFGVGFHF
ncbi:porin family protein [Steroidobacter sp. S1-65]|uniref:Porin family protein n=1 Tax=Steroidobacter gossypii TaxID=2805490 RepID=A0ABS1X0Q7_9GAMM|nr:porin family protein [Steroidobacter gossypii]MBM0106789.1 porin family protein [Steroidobacter gossypii]